MRLEGLCKLKKKKKKITSSGLGSIFVAYYGYQGYGGGIGTRLHKS
jgi:hypothetical protein